MHVFFGHNQQINKMPVLFQTFFSGAERAITALSATVSPSDGQHACSRVSTPSSWSFEEQVTLLYPLALSERLQRGLVSVFLTFYAVAFSGYVVSNVTATSFILS